MLRALLKTSLLLLLGWGTAGLAQTAPAAGPARAPANSGAGSAVKIEQQESFLVVGITVRTNNAAEASGQGKLRSLWEGVITNGTLDQVPHATGGGLVVVYSNYASDHTGDYDYTLGVRVSSADKVPEGMVLRKIEAGKYAVISSEKGPAEDVIPALWQRINSMTPEQLGGQRAYRTDFETYPEVTDWGSMQMAAHIGLK
jgi:predicted transcriptional regulator YdeE